MPSIFSQIIKGIIPSFKLKEDDTFFAFLDINPISPGHTLVVPKSETDYFFDMNDTELGGILNFSKPLSSAIQQATGCKRVGLMVAGFDVPHAHLHLVPINGIQDLSFSNATPANSSELEGIAKTIRQFI